MSDLRIPYPIPHADRERLMKAGKEACKHHWPRDCIDSKGNASFVATADYRADRKVVESIENQIRQTYGVEHV